MALWKVHKAKGTNSSYEYLLEHFFYAWDTTGNKRDKNPSPQASYILAGGRQAI